MMNNYWDRVKETLKNYSTNSEIFYDNMIVMFNHGSYVYGTNSEKSDHDIIVIINDKVPLISYYNGIYEQKCTDHVTGDIYDFQIMNDSTFKKMIYDHHIIAIESLWMHMDNYSDFDTFYNKYYNLFILDKWKLRQTISSIVNNAYAKCHKKLTVEKDYDLYRAQKSMFHCIRLYMFGIQICKNYRITNYKEANKYWDEIKTMGNDWEEYKSKFKLLINELRSNLVLLCPKPKSNDKI